MATNIEWTDETWNPTRGCSRISEGCRHCYAEGIAARFSKPGMPFEGFAQVTAPRDLLDRTGGRRNGWTGKVDLIEDKLLEPLSWRTPRKVFVNSMSDLFHEALPDEAIDRVYAVMALAPHHVFQVLTKRAERMRDYFAAPDLYQRILNAANNIRAKRPYLTSVGISNPATHPPKWIWKGVSVEDQPSADTRIPLLLQTPGAVRFLSCEPLLSGLDLAKHRPGALGLHWVIVGGESGAEARPCKVWWVRNIVGQCRDAGIAVFVKQLGKNVIEGFDPERPAHLRHAKGGDPLEWSEDLRIREFPQVAA